MIIWFISKIQSIFHQKSSANLQLCPSQAIEMSKKTLNIIFDFGNVLMNLNVDRAKTELYRLLGVDYDLYHEEMPSCYAEYEMGKISTDEFRERLENLYDIKINPYQFTKSWNSLLQNIPISRIRLLEELKKHYKLILLSNTNSLHMTWVAQYLKEQELTHFFDLFEHVYLSYKIGIRKPDKKIFQYVLDDAKILPEQTIFFDDGKMHIDAALALGINAYWHNPETDISELIAELNLLA